MRGVVKREVARKRRKAEGRGDTEMDWVARTRTKEKKGRRLERKGRDAARHEEETDGAKSALCERRTKQNRKEMMARPRRDSEAMGIEEFKAPA